MESKGRRLVKRNNIYLPFETIVTSVSAYRDDASSQSQKNKLFVLRIDFKFLYLYIKHDMALHQTVSEMRLLYEARRPPRSPLLL